MSNESMNLLFADFVFLFDLADMSFAILAKFGSPGLDLSELVSEFLGPIVEITLSLRVILYESIDLRIKLGEPTLPEDDCSKKLFELQQGAQLQLTDALATDAQHPTGIP